MRMSRIGLAVAVLALGSNVAFAQTCTPPSIPVTLPNGQMGCFTPSPSSVPEISANAAGGGLVLLAGSMMLIRGRRRKVAVS